MPDSNEREDLKLLVANSYEVITTTVQFACLNYNHGAPSDEVEELRGQVIVLLLKDDCHRLKTYDPDKSSFNTWLQHVTNHYVSRYFQKQPPAEPLEDLPPDLFSYSPTQEKELLKKEQRTRLREDLHQLTPHDQHIARLKLSDATDQEIAQAMKIKPRSVQQEWSKIVRKLKTIFKRGKKTLPNNQYKIFSFRRQHFNLRRQ